MPQFNLYPSPYLPLTGNEVIMIAQQQEGGRVVTCTVALTALPLPTALNFGPSSSRPVVAAGTMVAYFDTTLGQPIWGSSTGWVNAAGVTV